MFHVFCNGKDDKKHDAQFILKGSIKGNNNSHINLRYFDINGKYKSDTCEIKRGQFLFKGSIKGATLASLSCETISNSVDDPNFVEIYLEPNTMNIELEFNNFKNAKVSGSRTQNEWIDFRITQNPLISEIESIYSLMNQKISRMEEINDTNEIQNLENEVKELRGELIFQNKVRKHREIQFIKNNPESCVSAELLTYCAMDLSFDTLKMIYNKFSPNVLKSRSGENLTQLINRMSNSEEGAEAPDFTILNFKGEALHLSDYFQKKIILLEFWASWCQPCRASFPQLKEIHKQYDPNKLEIIAISRDMDEKAWREAIKIDAIEKWEHCSVFEDYKKDEKGIYTLNEVEQKYYIPGIPLTILIDKAGIVAGFYFGKSPENFENLKKKLATLLEEK